MTGAVVTTELPADMGSAVRAAKAQLRRQIGDVAAALDEVGEAMRVEVASMLAEREAGEEVWPVARFADVANDRVPPETVEAIRRRGCLVVKGTFPRQRADGWDAALASYTDDNHFAEIYQPFDDGVFSRLAAGKPSIFPIYWSKPQIQARQDDNTVAVRGFLNGFWKHESEGRMWFDPNRDTAYPDRVRRRPPGVTSRGLSPHTDNGSVERWLLPAYQRVFRHIYSGQWSSYDPWDGAYRTDVNEYPSTVMCSAFRTFQGWTALSDMKPAEGVLHVVPIPSAMAYLLLRALQDDVAEDDLCGAVNGRSIAVVERYHSVLLPALTPIPAVEPGDTVWWHADIIHSVGEASNQNDWANVMYIPASPYCEKNAAYAQACGQAFLAGASPGDFAAEDYETGWTNRATVDDLNETGRKQLGLQDW
jgi:hypothetical protein